MPNPVWPPSLMTAVRIGWQATPRPMVKRSTMTSGVVKVARLRTKLIFDYEVMITLRSKAEFDDLMTFWAVSCKGGAQAFDWKKPQSGATSAFRFTTEPRITNLTPDGICEVAFSLEDA